MSSHSDVLSHLLSSLPISVLYTDILTHLFDFLSIKALSKAMQTHKAWLSVVRNMRVQSQGTCVLWNATSLPQLAISSLRRHITSLQVHSLYDSDPLSEFLHHLSNLTSLSLASFHHTDDTQFIKLCKFPQSLRELVINEYFDSCTCQEAVYRIEHDIWANHMLRAVSKLGALQKFTWRCPLSSLIMKTPTYLPSIPWPCFDNLISLTTIDIFQQSLFEALPVSRMASLTDLTLCELSAFTPIILQHISQQLKSLKITKCHAHALQQIGQLSMLSKLDIGFYHSISCKHQEFQCLSILQTWTSLQLKSLTLHLEVNCGCNNFHFAIPFLCSQRNLSGLSITSHYCNNEPHNICYGQDDIENAFSHFKNLKKLKLGHPQSRQFSRSSNPHAPYLCSYPVILERLMNIPQIIASLEELHLEKNPDLCYLVPFLGLKFPALTSVTTDQDQSNELLKSFRLQSQAHALMSM